MGNKSIYLVVNQPVVRYGTQYFCKTKNFLDFMAAVAKLDTKYRLVVPCKEAFCSPDKELVEISLPRRPIELLYYDGHVAAFVVNLLNAILLRKKISNELKSKRRLIIAGPGPNSFLFWVSMFVPRSVKFAFFIRGDTLRTVKFIYRGSLLASVVYGFVKLFQWRIITLMGNGRCHVFLFGKGLQGVYGQIGERTHEIAALIDESFISTCERADIPSDRPLRVLYVGRLSQEKGILSLMEAVIRANKSGITVYLDIVGYGPLEKRIHSSSTCSRLSDRITLKGYIRHGEKLISELDDHDFLCLTSYTEGIPRSVIEAIARGMPVLSTRVGSLPYLFPDNVKFIDGFSVESIMEGIKWCNMHRKELSEMGKRAKSGIERFLISENAKTVNETLQGFC